MTKGKTLSELHAGTPEEIKDFKAMVSEKVEMMQIARDMKAIRFRRIRRERHLK